MHDSGANIPEEEELCHIMIIPCEVSVQHAIYYDIPDSVIIIFFAKPFEILVTHLRKDILRLNQRIFLKERT